MHKCESCGADCHRRREQLYRIGVEEKMKKTIAYLTFVLVLSILTLPHSSSGLNPQEVTLTSTGSIPLGAPETPDYTVSTLAQLNTVMSQVAAGDLVYIRGGTYQPTSRIVFTKSGTSASPITFAAYPGEEVIFDGSSYIPSSGSFSALLVVNGDWNILRKIKVRNAQAGLSVCNGGIVVFGDDCTIDHCEMYNNAGMGGATYGTRTKFLYCIAHDNVDNGVNQGNGGNADGFGSNAGGSNAYFLGCLSYGNSDDGFDNLGSTGAIVEECISYANGLLQGDGSGFKTGANETVRKCIAFNNNLAGFQCVLAAGFTSYASFDHCTAYNNGIATPSKPAYGQPGFATQDSRCVLTNSIGTCWYNPVPTHYNNTWDLGIANYGFNSTDSSSTDYLSLSSTSLCRGKASDGRDLGALQYGERISDLLT
jgi:hypothetical protein